MKKIIVMAMATIAGLAISSGSFAQDTAKKMKTSKFIQADGRLSTTGTQGGTGKVQYQDFHFIMRATEGANSQAVPGGTLQFARRGESISNFVFLDSLGNRTVLTSTRPSTNGTPTPKCKSKLPDACFGTASKNVGLCICKSTDLTYTMELNTVALSKLPCSSTVVIRLDY